MNKKLLLEDGTEFYGEAFGDLEDSFGEVVFVTSMTGYQELLTDPSLFGKIVVMAYPMIGNYGINRDDYEALQPYVRGFVVREFAKDPSNFRMNKSLEDYLKKMKVPALCGIDTRKLTKHIREKGTMRGQIVNAEVSKEEALSRLKESRQPENEMAITSTKNIYQIPASGKRVVLVDYGTKSSIIRRFSDLGYHLTVVPYNTDANDILELNPDAVVLAGGTSNSFAYPELAATVREIVGKVAIFGIGAGQYLLALACGADIKPMKFIHYGNGPIKNLKTGKIHNVSLHYAYTVHDGTLTGTDLEPIFTAVNDGTIQGLKHKKLKAFSVQFQPDDRDGNIAFIYFQEMLAN